MVLKRSNYPTVVVKGRFSRNGRKTYDYFVPEHYIFANDLQISEWKVAMFDDEDGSAIVNTPYERGARFFVDKILIDPEKHEHQAKKYLESLDLSFIDYHVLSWKDGDTESVEDFRNPGKKLKVAADVGVHGIWLHNTEDGKIWHSEDSKTINKTEEKGKKSMKKMFKNIKGFDNIGMVEGVFGLSFMDNQLAVKVGDSFFSFNKETGVITDASTFVMELPLPAMVLPAQVSELKVGDIILHEGQYVFVKEAGQDEVTIVTAGGEQKTKTLVKNALMGNLNFVEKLTSPFGDAFTTQNQNGGNIFSNPMMMMAMMDGKDGDSDDMFKMMMMSQMFTGIQAPHTPAVKPSDD